MVTCCFYLKQCPGSLFKVVMGKRHTQSYPSGRFNSKELLIFAQFTVVNGVWFPLSLLWIPKPDQNLFLGFEINGNGTTLKHLEIINVMKLMV